MSYDLLLSLVFLMLCYCLSKTTVALNRLVNVMDVHTKQVRMIHDEISQE